jgi:alpha-beta hydrolase superfamily lysophospholipase
MWIRSVSCSTYFQGKSANPVGQLLDVWSALHLLQPQRGYALLSIQGLADQAVLPRGATTLLRRVAAEDKMLVTFPQMNHSLLWDVDTPLIFEKIRRWLKEH